jgi:hypothetical protein
MIGEEIPQTDSWSPGCSQLRALASPGPQVSLGAPLEAGVPDGHGLGGDAELAGDLG